MITRRIAPRIAVSKFGAVSVEELDGIVAVMRECYDRLSPHNVALVDLWAFDRSSSLEAFLARERSEVGVVSAAFDELFFGMHDAWRGTPRIILCFERMRGLPELVRVGGIRHEVGHSVLHGSLMYYLLPLPPALRSLVGRLGLTAEYATNLLYLISVAVKDYEVTRLLRERGYVEDQVAYVRHLLRVSEDDVLAWRAARGRPLAEALCLVSSLKPSGCAAPLLPDEACGREVERTLWEGWSYLPANYSALLWEVVSEDFPSLGADTLENIRRASAFVAEKVIEPALQG